MEELSAEELENVLNAPQRKRSKKTVERTFHAWFYDVDTFLGQCDNPDCNDPRGKSSAFVWTHPEDIRMCRFCFLEGYLAE